MQYGGKKSKARKAKHDKKDTKPPNPGSVYFHTYFRPVIVQMQAEMQEVVNKSGEKFKVNLTQASSSLYNQGADSRSKRKEQGTMVMAEAFVLDWKDDEFFYNDKFEDPFNSTAKMPQIVEQLLSYIEDNHPMIYNSFGADKKARTLYFSDRDKKARIEMSKAYEKWLTVFGDKDDDLLGGEDDDSLGGEHEEDYTLVNAEVTGFYDEHGRLVPVNRSLGGNGAAAPVPPSSPPPPGVGKVSAPVEKDNETESEDDTIKPVGKQDKQSDPVDNVKPKQVEIEQVKIKPDPDGPADGAAKGAAAGAAKIRKREPLTPEEKDRRVKARAPDNEVIEID